MVSPLLALMWDQAAAACWVGVSAEMVNSSNVEEWDGVFERHELDSYHRPVATTLAPVLVRRLESCDNA